VDRVAVHHVDAGVLHDPFSRPRPNLPRAVGKEDGNVGTEPSQRYGGELLGRARAIQYDDSVAAACATS
jgi:hypothetical protein